MAGKAKFKKTYGTKLKEQTTDIKRLYSLQGSTGSPRASTRSFGVAGGSSTPPEIDEYARLKTQGDTMIGAISYFPKITVIDGSGEIDVVQGGVGALDDDYTSYLIVTPVGVADDLETINGVSHAGQLIHLEANTTGTITLKHDTGNIFIPSESDHTISAGGFATLIYDIAVHANKWVLVSASDDTSGATIELDNLGTTSVNSNLIMQAGISVTNLEGVFFATRSATPIAGSITYDGTDLIGKKSDNTEVNLTTPTSTGANTSLSNLSATAVNVDLDPDNSGTNPHLGDATKIWEVIYGKDIHVSGSIKTEPTSDHVLDIYTAGGKRLTISDNASNGAGYAELFGVIAGSGETQTHPSYKTVATDASPADNDMVGALGFDGYNSATERLTWARMVGVSDVVTDSAETAHFELKALQGGTEKTMLETDQFGIYLSNDTSGGGSSPAYNGAIYRDGNDIKCYTGGGTKNLSDIGTGSGGADTDLSNLTGTGESHFDSTYATLSGGNSISGTQTFTGDVEFDEDVTLGSSATDQIYVNGDVDFLTNTASATINFYSLFSQGYITIKIGGVNKRLYYFAG